jgi:ABC-type transporter Mla subunit MlaD
MAGNVESSGKRLIGEVDRTSASFSGLENGLNKLLGHADNGMRDLNGRTTEAAATLADLSDKIQVLSRSAQEVTTLLSGLIKVIADVNNFIHADDSWHR